jgi:hypothetical protein
VKLLKFREFVQNTQKSKYSNFSNECEGWCYTLLSAGYCATGRRALMMGQAVNQKWKV